MDPAIIGSMRVGHFRIGVFRDDWDRILTRTKNVASDGDMLVDEGIVEVVADDAPMPIRVDVRRRLFDSVKGRVKKV